MSLNYEPSSEPLHNYVYLRSNLGLATLVLEQIIQIIHYQLNLYLPRNVFYDVPSFTRAELDILPLSQCFGACRFIWPGTPVAPRLTDSCRVPSMSI